jgi:hypothetical protein
MTRFAFLILIIISLMNGSCSGRKNKLDKRNMIPEKELVSVLTDIHISEGLLILPKINYRYNTHDTINSYSLVLEKHGYSKEDMDRTIKYYFIKNPKKLIKIYDQVLGILSENESLVNKELNIERSHFENLWPGKDFYSFPDLSGNDSTMFDININKAGVYTLTFTVSLFPDDQSSKPRLTLYSCNPDSIETGKRRYIKTVDYIKDGRPHTYILTVPVQESTVYHLRGWLYDFDNPSLSLKKHVKIENISLAFSAMVV